MNDNPLQTMWGLIGFFLIFGGLFMFIKWSHGDFAPEMKLAKQLEEGFWVMLDESWRDECQARNSYYSTSKRYYHGISFFGYSNTLKSGGFRRYDPDYEKMKSYVCYEINGDIITIRWKNGNDSFRVLWQNEDIMGLQDPTDFNGPIRWYRRQ